MDLAERSIAVTGATGFLGRYICNALVDRGARVVGTLRSPHRDPDLSAKGVVLRPADLVDTASLRSVFEEVEAVVANAGLIAAQQTSNFVRINVDGMRNLLEAVVEANVRRLIVVSTVSIYRHKNKEQDEKAAQVPYTQRMLQRRPYAATKARAEWLAWNAAEKAGLDLTVVRPGYIYGRGARFLEGFRSRLSAPVAVIPCKRIPLAYAGDVAEAIARCLERAISIGRAYNLTGREDLSWCDFASAWSKAGGPIARVRVHLPWRALHSYDTSSAETDLNWTNTNFVEALAEILKPMTGQQLE
jgi:UDP-glucose 4-epimerase